MSWLRRIFAGGESRASTEGSTAAQDPVTAPHPMETIADAFAGHRGEIDSALTPQRRALVLQTWRNGIDKNAHAYADLALAYPDRQRIIAIEVEAMMQAFITGYMASRGWVETSVAEQAAFFLGRRLRDELRGIGVQVESAGGNVGVIMNEVLREIVALGQAAT